MLSSCLAYTNWTGEQCLGSATFLGGSGSRWGEGGGGKTLMMTDQPTMQLNQVSLSKNVECTLYFTIVLFTVKAGLTESS